MSEYQIKEMLAKLEKARKTSEYGGTYFALSNGENIIISPFVYVKEYWENKGYWLFAICQHGCVEIL